MHFKDFMCVRMRKLHTECQIPADAHGWCQIVFSFNAPNFIPKYWTTKSLSKCLGDRLELWPSMLRKTIHKTDKDKNIVATYAVWVRLKTVQTLALPEL